MKKLFLFVAAGVAVVFICRSACLLKGENKMSDLAQTDPEFAALWENFAGKDVKNYGKLDAKTRYLSVLAAHVAAAPSPDAYKIILSEALDNGVSPIEAKETVYQTIPYAGFAKAYDFMVATNEVFAKKGIKLPLAGQSTTTEENRLQKGLSVQKEIFGTEHIENMRANAPAELKHIQDYLSANCFGDYYTRGGLDLETRELLTFVTLAALGGADPQLKAHAQGNVNIGNDRQKLLDVVTRLLPYIGYPRTLNAIAAINSVSTN